MGIDVNCGQSGQSSDCSPGMIGIDIKFKNNVDLFNIVSALMKVGFVRVGINYDSKFVHCDISMDKTQKVLFTY